MIRALLEGGADPNLHGTLPPDLAGPVAETPRGICTPIVYVLDSRWGSSQPLDTRFATLQLLLEHGAALDMPHPLDGTYPLHEAVISGWPRHFITALLDHQQQKREAATTATTTTTTTTATPTTTTTTTITTATPPTTTATLPTTTTTPPPPPAPIDIVPLDIINAGTLLGTRDPALRATTPLMYAAGTGRAWLVRLLLARGADPHAANALGETALHWAGVNVAGTDAGEDGMDGMYEVEGGGRFGAAGEGAEIIRVLVQGCGVGVDVRCETGATPLHGAAYRGRMENVRALLELGADVRVVARDLHYERLVGVGGTAEEMARGEGFGEVADFIGGWERERLKGGLDDGGKADGDGGVVDASEGP